MVCSLWVVFDNANVFIYSFGCKRLRCPIFFWFCGCCGAMMTKRTIITIAERVGVSPATVSRALNNLPGVSADKRRRILAMAAELDYHPNVIARSLQGQRTNTVAYVADVRRLPVADLFFFKDFITALAEQCAVQGLDLLIHPRVQVDGALGELGRLVRSGRADGLIVSDVRHGDERVQYLVEQGLPFVAFGRSRDGWVHASVDVDGVWGLRAATRHLFERGHRRIAFLGLPMVYCCATDRYDGYVQAFGERGLMPDPALVATGLAHESDVRVAMERLLALPDAPTAFAAASDQIAMYAMGVAAQHGFQAGLDYAITGFDDLPMAAHTSPPLSTMRQPFPLVAQALIGLLAGAIDGRESGQGVVLLPELVVRGSS